jgi:tRNA A-37 threonylcarbamoyl transferase component Bud32
LSKRVESIVDALKDSSYEDYNGTVKEKALQNLIETLEETVNFVKKFIDASVFDRFFHNADHQQQFEMLNMQLSHNISDLKLALDITSIFDQHQDMIDRQADLDEISSKLDDIALAMAKQQQELLDQKTEMKNEFKRRFDSFKFHLQQDVVKAQNRAEAKIIDDESKLFLHISGHDLASEELIGQGGFADVYRGTWISQRHRVAIKTIRITYLTDDVRQDFLDEIAAMCRIRFDHVLNIFGACIEPNYYALVVEYMSLGSLFNVLQKNELLLSWTDRLSIALQMTKSVNYLHTRSILHRDIKSLNFLMEKAVDGYLVKISDFGLAKIRQETSRQTTKDDRQRVGVGTLQWKAPEILKFGKPSKASDIYSLGIVFWELATGCVPYEELDEATISQGVKDGERLRIPNDVPLDFASIISSAWSQEPSKRPTSQELIHHIMTVSTTATETAVM